MTKLSPRTRHLHALKHLAIAAVVYAILRPVGMMLWHKNPPLEQVMIEGLIACAVAYWFAWDSWKPGNSKSSES